MEILRGLCDGAPVMPPPPRLPETAGMDPKLEAFLRAPTPELADQALVRLLAAADPLIVRAIRRHERGASTHDTEDAASEARANLIARLRRLQTGEGPTAPIGDFDGYVCAVAYSAWALAARRRHPRWTALVNRLQYLLENRTNQRGFALWDGADGGHWAGFEAWRGKNPGPETLARHGRLAADPRTVAREIFDGSHGLDSMHLAELLAGLLCWLGGPARLCDLADAIATLQGISCPQVTLSADHHAEDTGPMAVAAPGPSPHDALRWREYLDWLWRETARLTLRQRTAFLLHSTCLRELELLGLASVRQAAVRLEVSAERMAGFWNSLPLEDRLIAAQLGIEIQQVINLRRVARDVLGRAWHRWLHEK